MTFDLGRLRVNTKVDDPVNNDFFFSRTLFFQPLIFFFFLFDGKLNIPLGFEFNKNDIVIKKYYTSHIHNDRDHL